MMDLLPISYISIYFFLYDRVDRIQDSKNNNNNNDSAKKTRTERKALKSGYFSDEDDREQ